MAKPSFYIEIFLQPGDFYFGDQHTRIRTLLGSCVSITLWHPKKRIGGMCHYMNRSGRGDREGSDLDGRYAEDVLKMFASELERSHTLPHEYEVKIFGGGNQFDKDPNLSYINIPDDNIEAGLALLTKYGFTVTKRHLGGNGYRHVIFDLWSGHVWMRHVDK